MTAAFLLVAAFACPDDQKLRLDLEEWKAPAVRGRRLGCEAPEVYVYARAGGKYVRK